MGVIGAGVGANHKDEDIALMGLAGIGNLLMSGGESRHHGIGSTVLLAQLFAGCIGCLDQLVTVELGSKRSKANVSRGMSAAHSMIRTKPAQPMATTGD